jgi:hypothetical protein
MSDLANLVAKNRLRRSVVWVIAFAALLAVFFGYEQSALLFQWIEMRLC